MAAAAVPQALAWARAVRGPLLGVGRGGAEPRLTAGADLTPGGVPGGLGADGARRPLSPGLKGGDPTPGGGRRPLRCRPTGQDTGGGRLPTLASRPVEGVPTPEGKGRGGCARGETTGHRQSLVVGLEPAQ